MIRHIRGHSTVQFTHLFSEHMCVKILPFLDETIECVRCTCLRQQDFSKNNFAPGPPRPATCQDIPLPYGAITWDDGDCILDDWDTPVALRPGEERQW